MSLAISARDPDSAGVNPPPDDDFAAVRCRSCSPTVNERRSDTDRRRRFWWSLVYGNFNPRRRSPRRAKHAGLHVVDWHHSRLLAVVLAILVLCVCDAFLTLVLLQSGAREANPVMARVVYGDAASFTILKMLMTSCSVAVMVMLAGYRFLGVFRVELLLYLVLTGYLVLVGYELWMLRQLGSSMLHL